jgi:hypothetical protein
MRISFQFLALILFNTGLYSQTDRIIVNFDTIECRIQENSLDWISYWTQDGLTKMSDNRITKNGTDYISELTINQIIFSGKENQYFTTDSLIWKLDFSNRSPHFIWRKDYSTGSWYKDGFDTVGNSLFWLGLDFTHFTMNLGSEPRSLYSHLFFVDCNDFIITDKRFGEFREHFNFVVDTGDVTIRNNNVNPLVIHNKPERPFILDSIRNTIASFKVNHRGVGMVIFITYIDKPDESITFYTTFVDIESKTVLLCLKQKSQAAGIGQAWHWTKPIKEALDELITKNDWKKRYSKIYN